MSKISKSKEYEKLASEDVEKWESRELGGDPKHTKPSEFERTTATSIRLSVKMVADLKTISREEGIPKIGKIKRFWHTIKASFLITQFYFF